MVSSSKDEVRIAAMAFPKHIPETGMERKRLVLVPFEPATMSSQRLEAAVELAAIESAELVLLCVRHPARSMWYAQEEERCYSKLKSLQAQLQKRSMRVRIETVTGAVAQFVLDFTAANKADVILIGGQPGGSEDDLGTRLFTYEKPLPSV